MGALRIEPQRKFERRIAASALAQQAAERSCAAAHPVDGLMWKDYWADLEGSRLSRGLVCNLVQHDLVQDARAELQVFDRRALAQAVEINRWPES